MKFKNIFPTLISVLLLIVSAICIKTCSEQNKEKQQLKAVIENTSDSVQYWRDQRGIEHARRKLIEGNQAAIKLVFQKQLDSLSSILKVSKSQIQSVTAFGTQINQTVKLKVDTIYKFDKPVYEISYNDKWASMVGQVTADSSWLHYSIRDSLLFTTYSKRKWFLGKKEIFVDAFSQNPNLHIKGLNSYRVTGKTSKFSIGPYIGIGYSNGSISPAVGFALQYSLIDL